MFAENFQSTGNRRDRILILSKMLSCAIDGIGRTELMYKAGLSSAQANKYVSLLVKSELMEIHNHNRRLHYKTTARGRSFLDKSITLRKLLS